ncbi:hypothetical protein FRC06_008461, partial [Ceratobasidium sp. 370]
EYQVSSQRSSRPPSPSERTSANNPKKFPFGKRSERPGCIVQPANIKIAAYDGSLEPVASAGPQLHNMFLASQGPRSDGVEVIRISRAEAIRQATVYLGADASHLDSKTIQRILDQIMEGTEENYTGPLEPEGGSALALVQLAGRVVLGSRHQPPAPRTAGGAGSSQGTDAQPPGAHDSYVPEGLPLEQPPADDTATEPESEHESVELGPRDSVSQQPLLTRQTPHPPCPIATPPTPHPTKTNPVMNNLDDKSDTATISESDEEHGQSEHDSEIVCAPKRQLLAHHSPSPAFHISYPIPSTPRKPVRSARPPIRPPPLVPSSSANSGQSLSKPPPLADLNAVLAWAVQVAKQAVIDR